MQQREVGLSWFYFFFIQGKNKTNWNFRWDLKKGQKNGEIPFSVSNTGKALNQAYQMLSP